MTNKLLAPYRGDELFAFATYAHGDADCVFAEIAQLQRVGARIWYDREIRAAQEWLEEIANAINASTVVLAFVSPRFVDSAHCRNEVTYALRKRKRVLPIHLEPTVLPDGLELAMGSVQVISKYQMADDQFRRLLLGTLSQYLTLFSDAKDLGTFRFDDEVAVQQWLQENTQGDTYRFQFGDERYGREVLEKSDGSVTVVATRNDLDSLLELAMHRRVGTTSRDILVTVEERLGSPGWPEYQSWETNVRQYRGEATVIVAFALSKLCVSIVLPEHFRHDWSGW